MLLNKLAYNITKNGKYLAKDTYIDLGSSPINKDVDVTFYTYNIVSICPAYGVHMVNIWFISSLNLERDNNLIFPYTILKDKSTWKNLWAINHTAWVYAQHIISQLLLLSLIIRQIHCLVTGCYLSS